MFTKGGFLLDWLGNGPLLVLGYSYGPSKFSLLGLCLLFVLLLIPVESSNDDSVKIE